MTRCRIYVDDSDETADVDIDLGEGLKSCKDKMIGDLPLIVAGLITEDDCSDDRMRFFCSSAA